MKLTIAYSMQYRNDIIRKILIFAILFAGAGTIMAHAESNLNVYPNVIDMQQIDAEKVLKEGNITPNIIYGIANGYQDRTVFNQEINGSNLSIFVNKRLDYLQVVDKSNIINVNLSQMDNKIIHTNSTVVIEGRLLSNLKANEHLWIAVKPHTSIANWWPQSNGDIKPNKRGEFQGNAFLGGNKDEVFTIGVLILNDTLNRTFSEWEIHSKSKKSWPPITEGDPITGNKVSKNAIEDAALAEIEVMLKEEKIALKEEKIMLNE